MINRDPIPIRRFSRRRRLLAIIAGVFFVSLLLARSLAVFWTDFLWFDSVGQVRVWRTLIFTRVWLVVAASILAIVLFWLNLALADRLSPRGLGFQGGPDDELLERFQVWIGPRVRRMRLIASVLFGLLLGLGAAAWWEEFLRFRHGGSFGVIDPIFDNDIGLYIFRLPFYRNLFGWAFQLVLVILLVTAALHYLNGGIQVQQRRRVAAGVKVHLSVLFAVLAVLKAVGYQLDQWELLYSTRGQVIGASYTDVNAQLPALRLLVLISLVAAIILLVNLRFRGWTLPLVALGLWLFTSIVVGGLYPAFVQRFRVVPDEINREEEFVAHNIEFTRAGFGLTNIDVRPFSASPDLSADDLDANRPTVDNIRLWDPGVLSTTYSELQEIRTFYGIEDVDVDRYLVDGALTQVMVSARGLDENNIPGSGWVNERLVYTHGFGAVVSPANSVTEEGKPEFLVQDIPPLSTTESLEVAEPRIYFSDQAQRDHVVAASEEPEVDFPIGVTGENIRYNSYTGEGGIDLGGIFRRAAFALRFGEVDMLISGQLSSDSKVLLERNVLARVQKAAPFLLPDNDPYLVLLDGRMVWVVDLYTTTQWYPYSANADTSRLNGTARLPLRHNYIRNSVKTIVDAFDGTMTFYVVDPTDPLIQAQRKIFPTLFRDGASMPQAVREHLRYPEDLFRVQSDMYRLYHVTNPKQFFSNVDPWQIARDPSNSSRAPLRARFADEDGSEFRPMLPYYLLMKLPGDEHLSFIIMQPFTPRDRPNMVSFMVAKSGPEEYGQIINYNLPAEGAQQGPGQVGDFINQDPAISEVFTLLGQGGSRVIQGSLLVVPIEESLLYVQPIYITADQTGTQGSTGGIPEFKRAVVSFNGQIEMRDTLDEALAAVFGEGVPTTTPPDDGPVTVPSDISELIDAASQAFAEADAALRRGDAVTWAQKVAEAQDLIEQAQALLAEGE